MRMVFLNMGAMAKAGIVVPYWYQDFFQVMPFMFTALAIITMLKYKLKIDFAYKNNQIPARTVYLIWLISIFTVIGCILLPTLTKNKNFSDKATRIMNASV
jgi:hypothetical protein